MKASILDLRRRMRDVLRALDRNEPVTILYRGKEKGVICPSVGERSRAGPVSAHSAFGMWEDRDDMQDVQAVLRDLRKGRADAV